MRIEKTRSIFRGWTLAILLICSGNLSACSGDNDGGNDDNGELPVGNVTIKITPDKKTVLRNPLNGWVLYFNRGWDENFGLKQDMIM